MTLEEESAYVKASHETRVRFEQIQRLLRHKERVDTGAEKDYLIIQDVSGLPEAISHFKKAGDQLRALHEAYPTVIAILNAVANYQVYCSELEAYGVISLRSAWEMSRNVS
jgi:hypothetical protein